MKIFFCSIFCCYFTLLSSTLLAQSSIKDYTQQQVVPIASVTPQNDDFADLKALGDAIGDARIVMLGEQDHGDAPTFLAKTRIVKYLHEQKGFNVLAFESDFFGLNQGWEAIPNDEAAVRAFLKNNIFGIWTLCDACNDLLFQYIPAARTSIHPLRVTGFDNQLMMGYSMQHLGSQLDSVFRHFDLPVTHAEDYEKNVLPAINKWFEMAKEEETFNRTIFMLNQIEKELSVHVAPDDFWLLTIQNLVAATEQYYFHKKGNSNYYQYNNVRDLQMAENLKWLSQKKFSNEKIIVWAHNYHISGYAGHYLESFMNEAMTMGSVVAQDSALAKQMYILGFTSYEGAAGRIGTKPYPVKPPKKESVEQWIADTGNPSFAFLDFRPFNTLHPSFETPFWMSGGVKGNLYHEGHKAQWNRIFDGVFYIKTMYPCKE